MAKPQQKKPVKQVQQQGKAGTQKRGKPYSKKK